jgi:hypothetical protein
LRIGARLSLALESASKEAYTPAVEVYESETGEVLKLFLAGRFRLTACIAALDSALEDLIPRLTPEQATRLRIVILSNNEIVMNEMQRRLLSESHATGR